MDSEKIIELFDSCWFEMEILKKQSRSSSYSNFDANPDHQIEEKPSKPDIKRIPTRHNRSMSAQLSSKISFNSFSLSPDSVLSTPKLQTVLSGKEIAEAEEPIQAHFEDHVYKKKPATTRRRKRNSESKSLSDLEFEELKGFMDLGFVFTEEDNKDSRLVEIVPGLQRLGRNTTDDKIESHLHESAVSRPYLSEAWEVMHDRRKENPVLLNWKIRSLNNDMDMKDNLRWWAHTVAMSAGR